MATKLYLPDGVAAPITPPAPVGSTTWEHINSSGNWLQKALLAPDSSTLTTVEYAPDGVDDLTDRDSFHRQYVIGPLKGQTFSGNVTAQLQCLERLANCNLILTMKIITCTAAGVLRNTLLAITRASAEANTSLRNLTFTSTALAASQTCQDGDYLVLEIGLGGNITSGTGGAVGHDGSIRWGCNASSGDLPVDNTQVGTTYRGWVSFSTTIKFIAETEGLAANGSAGVGAANGVGAAFVPSEGSSAGAATASGKGAVKPHNDFSNDSHCVALYKFDNGALTVDSKGAGSNPLTLSTSPPTADTSVYQEGSAAANFVAASTQYAFRKDADLTSNFPLKSGTSNKKISICTRLYLTSAPENNNDFNVVVKSCFISPAHRRTLGAMLYNFNPGIKANWDAGNTSGDYSNNYVHGSALEIQTFYHLTFCFDDAALFAAIYIRDEAGNVVGTDAEFTVTDHIALFSDSDFIIGLGGGDPSNLNLKPLNGREDEVAIFDDLITPTEATQIARGIYAPTGGIQEAEGTSQGSSTVNGISGATKLTEGQSAGVATVTGIAAAFDLTTGSSDGVATVSANAAAFARSEGSSAGSGTAQADGAAYALSTGSSDGVAAADAIAAAVALTEGISAGSATVLGDGESVGGGPTIIEATGSSEGTATVSGITSATALSEGIAAGVGAATGLAAGFALTTGTAAGVGSSSGVAAGVALTTGSSDGTCTVLGDGTTVAPGQAEGTAQGSCTVTGISGALAQVTGSSAGFAALTAQAAACIPTIGSAAGQAALQGLMQDMNAGSTVGSSAGSSTVSGLSGAQTNSIGISNGIGLAEGISGATAQVIGTAEGIAIVLGEGEEAPQTARIIFVARTHTSIFRSDRGRIFQSSRRAFITQAEDE